MELEEKPLGPTCLPFSKQQDPDNVNFHKSIVSNSSSKFIRYLIPLMLVTGSGMQSYANGTIDALIVAFLLLSVGLSALIFLFQNMRPERRAFVLTYSVCVLAGGIAQCYSLAVFNNPQSTDDALHTFFPLISAQPPFMTMENMPSHNSPLAVVAWQQVYKLAWGLGLEFGPYTGVMFNAFVMGLVGSFTVRIAREFFGNDTHRLQFVGTLFAFNGLFILFRAVLIRDCFTIALNTLVLWGIVRWLIRQTWWNLLIAVFLMGISTYAMTYLRIQSVLLFGLYGFLAFLFWFFSKRLDAIRLIAILFAVGLAAIALPYLFTYFHITQETQTRGMEQYAEQSLNASVDDSLRMRLIVNQPLPIRLVMGSGVLMIYPIPLWAYFNTNFKDYLWIKGYNGIYQLFVIPLGIVGFSIVFRQLKKDRRQIALLFLAVYLLINMVAVVATSLEQRHYAQFMPAFIILAALPNTQNVMVKQRLRTIVVWWWLVVILVHITWVVLKW